MAKLYRNYSTPSYNSFCIKPKKRSFPVFWRLEKLATRRAVPLPPQGDDDLRNADDVRRRLLARRERKSGAAAPEERWANWRLHKKRSLPHLAHFATLPLSSSTSQEWSRDRRARWSWSRRPRAASGSSCTSVSGQFWKRPIWTG